MVMPSASANGPVSNSFYSQGTGTGSSEPYINVFAAEDPTPFDVNYPIKKRWINLAMNKEWILVSYNNQSGMLLANWLLLNGSGGGAVNTVTGTNGVTASPNTGAVVVSGINATTTSVGVASFDSTYFTVSPTGEVSLITLPSSITLEGDIGSVTSNLFKLSAALTAGATWNFSVTGQTLNLNVSDANNNIFLGLGAGNTSHTGLDNLGFGNVVLASLTSGQFNTVFGHGSGNLITTGSNNAIFGHVAAGLMTTGSNNTLFGASAGTQYTSSESNNILLAHPGVAGESTTMRLGSPGTQNRCFLAGVTGVTSSNPQFVTINSATSQLGVTTSVPVANGGTGATTFTAHGVLVGEGTSAIVAVGPGTAGQVLQSGGAAADPAYSTATYPSTTTANQLFYSSAINTVSGLATANSGVLTTSTSGVPSIDTTNFHVLTTGVQVKGNNTNTAPPAGFIGEEIRSAIASTSAVSIPTMGTYVNITSISLTAGIWDVFGIVAFKGASGLTGTQILGSVVTTSATGGTLGDNLITSPAVPTGAADSMVVIPSYRMSLATTTTVFLTGTAQFTAGTWAAYGRINAVRAG